MKIRKTFLEQIEIIQMNPSKDANQPLLPFNKKDKEIEIEYSIRSTPEIAAIYKKLKEISDDPEKVDALRNLSRQRGVDRKTFDEIKRQVEDEQQPFLNKKMKQIRVANLNQLQEDIKKIDGEFKRLKTNLTLKNLYKQSLRNILNKFFTIPGMKMPRRYLMLPMSYNNTLNDINELNAAENKYEKMFKILKNQIVIEPEKIDREIKDYLERHDYKFKDFENEFYNNICYTKNGAEVKISDEFEKIKAMIPNIGNKMKALEKAPADKQEFIKREIKKLEEFKLDYLNRMLSFHSEAGTGMGDQSVVVITWVPRLILTQSTGTPWTSCQHLITGSQNPSVFTGMQEGVFIAWLVGLKNVNDIRKPKARILIKPFLPKDKTKSKNIIWWSSKVYSESGGNFNLFKKVVNSFLYQKQQKLMESSGGISKQFALMSKKKNTYQKDNRGLYRIYPDDEQGYDLKNNSFDNLMKFKKPKAESVLNTHDFDPKAYMAFLKKMSDRDFIIYAEDNALLTLSMENNLPLLFNYIAERIKTFKLEDVKRCFSMIVIEAETNQVLVRMYINLLNYFYRTYEDMFTHYFSFEIVYESIAKHQLINLFLKESMGVDLIKKCTTKLLVDISTNSLIASDIKKNINILIKNKIETGNAKDIIVIMQNSVQKQNIETYNLCEVKLKDKFKEINSETAEDIVHLMDSVYRITSSYSIDPALIKKYSNYLLEIIEIVSDKKPNIISLVEKIADGVTYDFIEKFIEMNDLVTARKAIEIKSLKKIVTQQIDNLIDEAAEDSSNSYKNLISKIKSTEDLEFLLSINKKALLAVTFYLCDTFNLVIKDLTDEQYFENDINLVNLYLQHIEKNKNAVAFLKKNALFDDTFVQTHFNRQHRIDNTFLVKNINNPTLRKLTMFIIDFLPEEKKIEILTNIILFFVKGENSPMLWYVNEISKTIKDMSKIKSIIHNFSFGHFEGRIGDNIVSLDDEHLLTLLSQGLGWADINIDLFLKTFNLAMGDIIEILNKHKLINIFEKQLCHYLFRFDEFKNMLEKTKISSQDLKENTQDLLNMKWEEDEIKEFDYLAFYLKTKNNLSAFKKLISNLNTADAALTVYNVMAIFFKDMKINDIVRDNDIKNAFNLLTKKEAEKVLKDLNITYVKKDIDMIFA